MAGEPADECIFTPSRMIMIIGHSETCKHPLERHGYYYYQPTLSQPANCSLLVPMTYNVNNKLSRLNILVNKRIAGFPYY